MTKFRAYFTKTIYAFADYEVPDKNPEKASDMAQEFLDDGSLPEKITYTKDLGWILQDISPVEENK